MTRETTSLNSAPLQGIRVADFTWLWAGAYSTGLLALLGAEVIKIESMSRADPTRSMTFTLGTAFEGLEESFAFNSINLNKLSVKLNLKRPEAVELAKTFGSHNSSKFVNGVLGAVSQAKVNSG